MVALTLLQGHAGRKDAAAVQAVGHMPGGQCHHECWHKLEQAHQPEVPGAGGQVVHMPRDCHHEHLVAHDAGNAGEPIADEGLLLEQRREWGEGCVGGHEAAL